MRRPSSDLLLAAVMLALVGGCAGSQKPPAPPAMAEPAPALAPPETPPQPPERMPPVSIGPRPPETVVTPAPVPAPAPAPPPPPSTAPPVPPAQRGRFVVLNFDNADIETVVHAASEILGFNYVLAPDVRGKVTVQTSGRIPQEDVYGVLLAILEVHGFTAVKSDNLYKIVRIEGARERAVPTIVGAEADPARTSDEIITQIVPIKFSSVADISTLLRPLISARGTLLAHRETNVLMVTDTASNIRRLLDIIKTVDVASGLDELQILPVKYADAVDLATILNQLFASGRLRLGGTGVIAPAPAPVAPAPGTRAPTPVPTPAGGGDGGADRAPLIIAERRSNSLIVHARKAEMQTIQKLVSQLDVDIYGGRRVFIYFAENAKAKDLATTLNAIYGAKESQSASTSTTPTTRPATTTPSRPGAPPPPPGSAGPTVLGGQGEAGLIEGQIKFIADETTNAVIVTTYPRNWTEVEGTIKQLDKMPRQVLIEVLVTEITLTGDLRLGVDWALKEGSFRLAQQSINPDTPAVAAPSTLIPPQVSPLLLPAGGLTAFAFQADKFFALLNTLASEGRANVLSNPHVMTSENKKAVINVSDSIPIVTSQQVPIGGTTVPTGTNTTSVIGTQSVEYRDAGVILTVTPRIGERGTVAIDVKQEVNDIGNPEPPTGSRRIIKREAETSVVLLNNQTLVLGGLIKDSRQRTDRGIPFLKDIPLLGYFFGAKSTTTTKTELLILITPRVVGTALDAARITDQMRRTTPDLEDAMQRGPRPPAPLSPPAPPTR